jgi:hypothetical protein
MSDTMNPMNHVSPSITLTPSIAPDRRGRYSGKEGGPTVVL